MYAHTPTVQYPSGPASVQAASLYAYQNSLNLAVQAFDDLDGITQPRASASSRSHDSGVNDDLGPAQPRPDDTYGVLLDISVTSDTTVKGLKSNFHTFNTTTVADICKMLAMTDPFDGNVKISIIRSTPESETELSAVDRRALHLVVGADEFSFRVTRADAMAGAGLTGDTLMDMVVSNIKACRSLVWSTHDYTLDDAIANRGDDSKTRFVYPIPAFMSVSLQDLHSCLVERTLNIDAAVYLTTQSTPATSPHTRAVASRSPASVPSLRLQTYLSESIRKSLHPPDRSGRSDIALELVIYIHPGSQSAMVAYVTVPSSSTAQASDPQARARQVSKVIFIESLRANSPAQISRRVTVTGPRKSKRTLDHVVLSK